MYKYTSFRDAYKEARNYFEKGKVAAFPPYVTFELSNKCNFKCRMCYATYAQEKKEEMEMRLFKMAVDEIKKYGSMVRFIGYEEPFLYSGIGDAIRYVKDAGLLLHITTNGSLLDQHMRETVIGAGVDSLILSMQGFTENEYCAMRNVSHETHRKVIDNMRSLSKERTGRKPYIKVTTTITQKDDASDKKRFTEMHLEYADEVQVTGFTHLMPLDHIGLKDIWERLDVRKPEKIEAVDCFVPNYELFVKENGDIYVCCGPFSKDLCIGTLKSGDTLHSIWHSDKANSIRNALGERKFDSFSDCAVCALRYEYPGMRSTTENVLSQNTEKYTRAGNHV